LISFLSFTVLPFGKYITLANQSHIEMEVAERLYIHFFSKSFRQKEGNTA